MVERPSISRASAEWAEFGRARNLAEGTVRSRSQAVKLLSNLVGDIQAESVTPRHMERVFMHYTWAPSTRNVKLGIYKAFFTFCRARRFMTRDNDPLLGWRGETVPEVERTRVPVQEWPKLFAAAERPQERLIVACGLYLFLRASEIQQLQVKDLDFQNSLVDVYRRKTKQRDTMPISSELDGHLRQHLSWMAGEGFTDPEHYLLVGFSKTYARDERNQRWLPNTTGYRPQRPATQTHRLLQAVMGRAGVAYKKGEGVHLLRRSGARAYFDQLAADGYDGALRRVQSMLGHRNAIMTEVYLGLDLDRATRNADLAGKPMFPGLASGNVAQLRRAE
jgi:integrase